MTTTTGQAALGAAALFLACALPVLAEIARPAELPPPDFAGQQYVDSKGCLFMRAGQPGNEFWLPRVTRKGVPLCGNPPSGNRVPVVQEGAASVRPADSAEVPSAVAEAPAPAPAATATVAGVGYFVAVGSFGVAANAEKAIARLRALNYPVARGRMEGGSTALVTVFAGPFDSAADAAKAQVELRGAGFPDAMMMGR